MMTTREPLGGAGLRANRPPSRSGTTRRDGYVAAPDISATVLRTLGIKLPKKMQGDRIESRGGHGATYVRDLRARLDAILPHRDDALKIIAACWAAAAALLWIALRRDGLRAAGRISFLAATSQMRTEP